MPPPILPPRLPPTADREWSATTPICWSKKTLLPGPAPGQRNERSAAPIPCSSPGRNIGAIPLAHLKKSHGDTSQLAAKLRTLNSAFTLMPDKPHAVIIVLDK